MMAEPRSTREREAYAKWLQGYNWDYFVTCTFRYPRVKHVHVELEGLWYKPSTPYHLSYEQHRPRKEPYYAISSVYSELKQHGVARAFLVAEPHQSGDLHVHGIVAGHGSGWRPDLELPWTIWTALHRRFGRATVEACNNQEAVSSYCAKYILKQQHRVCDYYQVYGSKFSWLRGELKAQGQAVCGQPVR